MPNRDIKESCRTSPTLAMLSHGAERLFWRLTTFADDWGRMPADPSVVLGACMPRLLENGRVKSKDIGRWLDEMEVAGLISRYCHEGQTYAFFTTWPKHQRVRAKFSKYPAPTSADICRQVTADAVVVTEEPVVPEEPEDTALRSSSSSAANVRRLDPLARQVLAFLNYKAHRNYQPTAGNLDLIRARLKDGATVDQCRAIIGRKTAKWKGDPKMEEYLRPATLFNRTKFDSYLGELPATAFQEDPDA